MDGDFCPVFIQFLDCVHQLMSQYPFVFEFNMEYLLDIAENTFSCKYGTLLFNSIKEREMYETNKYSKSL